MNTCKKNSFNIYNQFFNTKLIHLIGIIDLFI